MACAKHWVAYGLPQAGRDYAPVDMSERTLFDTYLPPFKACIDAGVLTFMSAFNDINGIPSSGNPYLNHQILRNEWNYDGVLVSDWGSIQQMIPHGFCADLKEAAMKAANASVALERHHGKRKSAAKDLNISERTLYRKIKEYDLD